jgi:hypothetical protein
MKNYIVASLVATPVLFIGWIAYATACNCTGTTDQTSKENNCPENCTRELYTFPNGTDFPIECTLGGEATGVCTEGEEENARVRTLTFNCTDDSCNTAVASYGPWTNVTVKPVSCSTPVGGC